jgi:hypothetical protein
MSKALRLPILASFALAWLCGSALAQVTNSTMNPKQIATLHWYPANLTTSFPVVSASGVTFDGANIWVANNSKNTVTKLRPSDGAVLGVFGPLQAGPQVMAFDGANIWVYGQFLDEVRASDGAILGPVQGGNGPGDIVYDGTNIWVTCSTCASGAITKIRPSDGMVLARFFLGPSDGGRRFANGIVFDGANLWVTLSGLDATGRPVQSVIKLRPSDGAPLGTFAVGSSPGSVAFDGANIWVANVGDNTLTKLRATDGVVLGTFPAGTSPGGVVFDGANIWVTNQDSLTKLRASDGGQLGTFPIISPPTGIAFDGANIWVANIASGSVSKF